MARRRSVEALGRAVTNAPTRSAAAQPRAERTLEDWCEVGPNRRKERFDSASNRWRWRRGTAGQTQRRRGPPSPLLGHVRYRFDVAPASVAQGRAPCRHRRNRAEIGKNRFQNRTSSHLPKSATASAARSDGLGPEATVRNVSRAAARRAANTSRNVGCEVGREAMPRRRRMTGSSAYLPPRLQRSASAGPRRALEAGQCATWVGLQPCAHLHRRVAVTAALRGRERPRATGSAWPGDGLQDAVMGRGCGGRSRRNHGVGHLVTDRWNRLQSQRTWPEVVVCESAEHAGIGGCWGRPYAECRPLRIVSMNCRSGPGPIPVCVRGEVGRMLRPHGLTTPSSSR